MIKHDTKLLAPFYGLQQPLANLTLTLWESNWHDSSDSVSGEHGNGKVTFDGSSVQKVPVEIYKFHWYSAAIKSPALVTGLAWQVAILNGQWSI